MSNIYKGISTWVAGHLKLISALAGVGVIVIDDAVTNTTINWQTIVIGVLAAFGVYVVPNRSAPPPTGPAASPPSA